MEKLATGPEAADVVDIRDPVAENIHRVAKAKGGTLDEVCAEAQLAEQVGFDAFLVGEHPAIAHVEENIRRCKRRQAEERSHECCQQYDRSHSPKPHDCSDSVLPAYRRYP
jgi:alkanesulfonate monooxygenase SsuD/methylene tetrahydromethanopterin reductase-like flavin-dependent oxidoreductase (luciferase family)